MEKKRKKKKGVTILRVVVTVFIVAVIAALIYIFVAFRGVANDLNAVSGDTAASGTVALFHGLDTDASRGQVAQ